MALDRLGTGHAISARLNAHGQLFMMMLPHVMEHNMSVREEKRRSRANSAPSGRTVLAIDAVIQLRSDIGIDRSISDLGGQAIY